MGVQGSKLLMGVYYTLGVWAKEGVSCRRQIFSGERHLMGRRAVRYVLCSWAGDEKAPMAVMPSVVGLRRPGEERSGTLGVVTAGVCTEP